MKLRFHTLRYWGDDIIEKSDNRKYSDKSNHFRPLEFSKHVRE